MGRSHQVTTILKPFLLLVIFHFSAGQKAFEVCLAFQSTLPAKSGTTNNTLTDAENQITLTIASLSQYH